MVLRELGSFIACSSGLLLDLQRNPRGLQVKHWTHGLPHSHCHLLAVEVLLQVLQLMLHTLLLL